MGKYAEGKADGRAEGEELATHRIAKNKLQQQVAAEIVFLSTGLSIVEVNKINEEINKAD